MGIVLTLWVNTQEINICVILNVLIYEQDLFPFNGLILPFQYKISVLNAYAYNRTSKYMKQKLIGLNEEIRKSTAIVGDINTPLSIIDKAS